MAVSGPEQSYTFSDIKVVKSGRAENVTVTVTAKMHTTNKNFGNELNFNLYKNRRLVHTLTGTASQAVQDGSYSGYYNISFNFPSYEASHSLGHEDGIIVNDIVWFELTDYVEQSVDDICGFYFKAANSTGEANINEGLTKDTNSQIYYDPSLPSCSGCGLNFTDGAYVNGAYSYDSTFNVGLMTDASADYKIGVIATTIDYSSGSPKPGKEIGYILGFDGQAFELDFKLFDLSLTELYIRAANNRPYRTCGIKSGRYMMFGIAYYRLEDMRPVWGKPAWDANATEVMCEYSKELALNNGGAIIPEVQPHETTTVSLSVHTTLSFPKDLLYDLPYKLSLIISDNPTLGETYQYPSVEKTFDIIEALGSMYMQLVSSIYSIEEVKDLGEYNTVSNDIISTFDASEILYSDIEGFDENAIYYAGYKVESSSGGVWYFNNDNALQLNATPPVTVEEDVINVSSFEFNPTPSYLEAKIEGEVIKRNEGGLTLAWSFYDKTTESSLKTVVKDLEDYSPLILRETLDISTLENDVYGHKINVFCAIENKLTQQVTVLTPQTEESNFTIPTLEVLTPKLTSTSKNYLNVSNWSNYSDGSSILEYDPETEIFTFNGKFGNSSSMYEISNAINRVLPKVGYYSLSIIPISGSWTSGSIIIGETYPGIGGISDSVRKLYNQLDTTGVQLPARSPYNIRVDAIFLNNCTFTNFKFKMMVNEGDSVKIDSEYESFSTAPKITKISGTNVSLKYPHVISPTGISNKAIFQRVIRSIETSGKWRFHSKWNMSPVVLDEAIYQIGELQTLNDDEVIPIAIDSDGSTTPSQLLTVSNIEKYSYTFNQGAQYGFYTEDSIQYLGKVLTIRSNELPMIKFPTPPVISKIFSTSKVLDFYITKSKGGFAYINQIASNLTIFQDTIEHVDEVDVDFNDTELKINSVFYYMNLSGNRYSLYLVDSSNKLNLGEELLESFKAIKGNVINYKCNVWYALDRFSKDIIEPITLTDELVLKDDMLYCINTNTVLSSQATFNPDTKMLKLPYVQYYRQIPISLGSMMNLRCTIQISKSIEFTDITHQLQIEQEVPENPGFLSFRFPDVQLDESDEGKLYVKTILSYSNDENLYNMPDSEYIIRGYLNIKMPVEIKSFNCKLNNENKIIVNISGTHNLYVDLYKKSDNDVPYVSYKVISSEDFEIPLNEPGTIWFIKARSTDGTNTAILTETDEEGNEHEVEYQIIIPYTETADYNTVANPTLTADKLQLDNTANLIFNFEEIETNIDHVQYDIEMFTTNYPIDPLRFENVEQSLFNHTFESRLDDEVLSYELNVTLYNSFNDIVKKYVIKSNEVTLDSVDLDEPSIPSDLNTTYHSILYTLSAVNSQGWKLYRLTYELKSDPDKKLIKKYEFGDEEPTLQSGELTIPEDKDVLFENLKPKTTYWVIINAYFVNPIDLSKRKTKQQSFWGETRQFSAPAVNIHTMNITNQINNKPTVYSNFELSWGFNSFTIQSEKPTGYTVEYKKGNDSEYTRFNTQDKFYTLNPEMLDLHVNDEIYIRIGTIYYNKYVDETYISYYEFDKITVAETSYEYYRCSYPDLEIHQRKMYKMLNGEPTERMIRDIYMNK